MLRRVLISTEFVFLYLPSSGLLLYSPLGLYSGGFENLTSKMGATIGVGVFLIGAAGVCGLFAAQNLAAHAISASTELYPVRHLCAGLLAGLAACIFAIWVYSNWYTSIFLVCPLAGTIPLIWLCRDDLLAT